MKKRERESNIETKSLISRKSPRFFREINEPKVPKEEPYLISVFRKIYFPKIKQDLGENYTDQDVENVFQLLMEELRENGTIKKIMNDYLEIKIKREKEKFNSEHKNISQHTSI